MVPDDAIDQLLQSCARQFRGQSFTVVPAGIPLHSAGEQVMHSAALRLTRLNEYALSSVDKTKLEYS